MSNLIFFPFHERMEFVKDVELWFLGCGLGVGSWGDERRLFLNEIIF